MDRLSTPTGLDERYGGPVRTLPRLERDWLRASHLGYRPTSEVFFSRPASPAAATSRTISTGPEVDAESEGRPCGQFRSGPVVHARTCIPVPERWSSHPGLSTLVMPVPADSRASCLERGRNVTVTYGRRWPEPSRRRGAPPLGAWMNPTAWRRCAAGGLPEAKERALVAVRGRSPGAIRREPTLGLLGAGVRRARETPSPQSPTREEQMFPIRDAPRPLYGRAPTV